MRTIRGEVFRPATRFEVSARPSSPRTRFVVWLVIRLTGVLLSVLVLGHFALTHILNDVATTNATFIAHRWSTPLWVTWDSLMLAAALVHGGAGLWIVVTDYAHGTHRRILQGVLIFGTLVLFVLGTTTIARTIAG